MATMKENQHVQPVVDVEHGTVTFKVRGHSDLVLDIAKLHPDVVMRAALAGMAQVRIVDAAAIERTDDEGNIIPEADRIAMKHERMAALIAHYHTGTAEWSMRNGGGGGQSLTIRAIAKVNGWTYEEASEKVQKHAELRHGGDRKKALAKLREADDVQRAMQELRDAAAPKDATRGNAALEELKAL